MVVTEFEEYISPYNIAINSRNVARNILLELECRLFVGRNEHTNDIFCELNYFFGLCLLCIIIPFLSSPLFPIVFFQAVTNVDDRSAMRWRKSLREGKTCERESMGD